MRCVYLALLLLAVTACETPPPQDPPQTAPDTCSELAFDEGLVWEESIALESSFLYVEVDNPRALALMFHGGGGTMSDNLERIHPSLIAREALARGMAVASLDSYAHLVPDATNSRWEEGPPGDNNDLANAMEMVRKLAAADELDVVAPNTPLVLIGTSNGGSMASRVAQLASIDVAAAVIYVSNAAAFHEDGAYHPPMVLVPGERDPGHALSSNTMLAEQIGDPDEALLLINQPEAVTAESLTRIPGFGCQAAETMVASLATEGILDADLMLTVDPKEDFGWSASIPTGSEAHLEDLQEVMTEAYAGHAPSSDQNGLVFGFIEDQL